MTMVISHALNAQSIFYQCRMGYAEDLLSRIATVPHCWIELEEGWCIDLRLRQWLGDQDDLPHGVFQPSYYPRVRYQGRAWSAPQLDIEDLKAMTNNVYDKVKLP